VFLCEEKCAMSYAEPTRKSKGSAKNKAHLARAGGTRAAKNAGVAGGPSGSAWAPAVAIHQ